MLMPMDYIRVFVTTNDCIHINRVMANLHEATLQLILKRLDQVLSLLRDLIKTLGGKDGRHS